MNASSCCRTAAIAAAALAAASASAHVTLPPGGATAGDTYAAAFRVGHACSGARSTTGITVRMPEGFAMQRAEPRPGWTLAASPGIVSWRAESAQTALPAAERAEFVVHGTLTTKPGTLWFKVLQSCDVGASDWAEVPPRRPTSRRSRRPASTSSPPAWPRSTCATPGCASRSRGRAEPAPS